MKVILTSISGRGGNVACQSLTDDYLTRLLPYTPSEARAFRSESAFVDGIGKLGGRTPPVLVLLDSRGKSLSSEDFAGWVGRQRDGGVQTLVFAIGPADGWSKSALANAALVLSLGPMTLPHELARVVLAEQVYRAFTILANHPYHGGH